jgi:hypothetical protein
MEKGPEVEKKVSEWQDRLASQAVPKQVFQQVAGH